MRIGITDSGVGGLSVCAAVEAGLNRAPAGADLEILYLNAALRDDYAYNAMATRREKLEAFDCFLRNVAERYRPDLLYIACNSLSVLFRDPYFDHHRRIPTSGIIETGTRGIVAALDTDDDCVIVFATPTTIEEDIYRRKLVEAGVPADRIAQQACPGLPDAISNDFSGGQARALLELFVPEALAQFRHSPTRVLAFLGCTHYGYQADLFRALLGERVDHVSVLNPNRAAAESILGKIPATPGSGAVDIRLVTPYAIPDRPLASLDHYLGEWAPATVEALRAFELDPGLYRG